MKPIEAIVCPFSWAFQQSFYTKEHH